MFMGGSGLNLELSQDSPDSLGQIYGSANKWQVRNQSGSFIRADSSSVTAAAAGAAANMPADFRVTITDPPGPTAYPVSSFTWMLVPQRIEDPAKLKSIKEFLGWALTTGQDMLEPLGYAKLPKEVVSMEQNTIAGIHQ
jgi:phosphate transport system substrate-binding protein